MNIYAAEKMIVGLSIKSGQQGDEETEIIRDYYIETSLEMYTNESIFSCW